MKNTTFRKLDLFPSSGEGRHLLCWVFHCYLRKIRTMDKVRKPNISVQFCFVYEFCMYFRYNFLWLDRAENITWRVQLMKLLIMQFSLPLPYFLTFGSRHSPHQCIFLSVLKDPSFIPIWNGRWVYVSRDSSVGIAISLRAWRQRTRGSTLK
jgi:hypothetical protein